jgi:hypothetical protein
VVSAEFVVGRQAQARELVNPVREDLADLRSSQAVSSRALVASGVWFARSRTVNGLPREWPNWMNLRRTEPNVIDFLRATLAEQPRPVTKLEASARAAGLLNERQRITHAKAFKRAKKSLWMSLHAGFGARSQWLWELPRENTPYVGPRSCAVQDTRKLPAQTLQCRP